MKQRSSYKGERNAEARRLVKLKRLRLMLHSPRFREQILSATREYR